MNYTKPEVAVLGKAAQVIQRQGKVGLPTVDLPHQPQFTLIPAYDLDE